MTREETIKILMVVQAAYPNYKPPDKTVTVNFWYEMLSDYSYQQIEAAVKAFIRTDNRGFAPSIGDIMDKIQLLFGDAQLNEVEAWELVWKAICNSGYHSEEEFEKLPELAKKSVGSPSQLRQWALSNVDDKTISYWKTDFQRLYRTFQQREREINKLSPELAQMVQKKLDRDKIVQKNENCVLELGTLDKQAGTGMPESVKERFNKLFQED